MPSRQPVGQAGRVLGRAWRLRCPRCGGARLFTGWFAMAPACPLCGLRFERAPGYFVGAIYINYGVTTVITIAGYLLLWRYAGLSTTEQFLVWIPFGLLFPLWFFRYSRSFWLAIEYTFNPEH
jgi:uncharacterized protein (DUF983 family)